jgi:hypothetical protein
MVRVESGIGVNATAFVTAHPDVTKVCANEGLCVVPVAGQPTSVLVPADAAGDRTVEVTVTGAGGKTLLSSRVKVSVKAAKKSHGCSSGAVSGLVTVGADGRLTAS